MDYYRIPLSIVSENVHFQLAELQVQDENTREKGLAGLRDYLLRYPRGRFAGQTRSLLALHSRAGPVPRLA